MSELQPIETAPKDGRTILIWGTPESRETVQFTGPHFHTAYWEVIDQAWCSTTGDWAGPFISALKWMPLPEPPVKP